MQLCGAYVPDVDRITACMIQNKSQLAGLPGVFPGGRETGRDRRPTDGHRRWRKEQARRNR
jgi:hypothetical protein